jgi:multisubunit Na+/H+ antiporter MnhB subunit
LKYLLYFDAALAALGAAMTAAVSYVCLVFGLYQNTEPAIRRGFPGLLVVSACFLALALIAGTATWGMWKRRAWNWWAQGVLGVSLPVLYLIAYSHLQSQ